MGQAFAENSAKTNSQLDGLYQALRLVRAARVSATLNQPLTMLWNLDTRGAEITAGGSVRFDPPGRGHWLFNPHDPRYIKADATA